MQDSLPTNQAPSQPPAPVAAPPTVEPSISSQPAEPPVAPPVPASPPEQPKPASNVFLWVAVGVLFVAGLAAAAYYLMAGKTGQRSSPSPSTSTLLTPSPSPTEGWKVYRGETIYSKDGSTMFEVKYPPLWVLDKTTLYPFGKPKGSEIVTKVLLGAAGHGWVGTIEKRTFSAGEASYSWVDSGKAISAFGSFTKDSKTYILEIQNLATDKGELMKPIFDNMLESFKFVEATASASPTASPTASPSSSPSGSPTATPSY